MGALDQPQPRPHCDRDRTATARHLPFPCSERATSARSSRPGCWWRVVFDRRLARGVAVARASASATVSIPCEGGPRWRPHGAVTGVGWGDAVTVRLRWRWLCGCGGGGCAGAVAVAVRVRLRWLCGCSCGGCAGAVSQAHSPSATEGSARPFFHQRFFKERCAEGAPDAEKRLSSTGSAFFAEWSSWYHASGNR